MGFKFVGKKTEISDFRVEKELYIGKNTRSATIKVKEMLTDEIGKVISAPRSVREVTLVDDTAAVTVANLQQGILLITPTANRTKALPDADDIISALELTQRYQSVDITVVNITAATYYVAFTMGTNCVYVGASASLKVLPATSATFRFVVNNAAATQLKMYRL
jgi:hypothetical protein